MSTKLTFACDGLMLAVNQVFKIHEEKGKGPDTSRPKPIEVEDI